MKHLKCFSLKYLVRYIVVAGAFSALAGAQQPLQLSLPATYCQVEPAVGRLHCTWSDPSGCTKSMESTPSTVDPVQCLNSTSIQFKIDNGTNTTIYTDTCEQNITVDNGCGAIQTQYPISHDVQVVADTGDGAADCVTDPSGRITQCTSPVIVDTSGEGFHLTSATDGVRFDIRANGHPLHIAWTAAGSGNGFLALDRNHNGTIDDGSELFGNFTQQPNSPTPNGFLALAEFDKPENGGNGDGIIDEHDAVYSHLVIWIDENHDGISQPTELHTLPELGMYSLSFQYKESRRTDEFGNLFRYRAKVNPGPNDGASDAGRWAVDVFLTTTAK